MKQPPRRPMSIIQIKIINIFCLMACSILTSTACVPGAHQLLSPGNRMSDFFFDFSNYIATKMYELDTNGGVYEGQLNNGKRDGLGKMTWADGDVFEGQWKNEKLNGLGRMTFPSGDWVEGQFKDNIPIETQTVKTAMARYGGVSAFQIKDGKVEAIYDANGDRRMLRTANGMDPEKSHE